MPEDVANELIAVVEAALPRLNSLTEPLVTHRPAPDRWTIKEVVGHLLDSAANNHQRFVRAQFVSELVFPRYEQNDWVQSQNYNAADWPQLVELWRLYNLHLAHVIRNIAPDRLNVLCKIGDYEPMSLQALAEDYVAHLKHHLAKIEDRAKARA
jgi:DinB superfamily